MFYTDYILFTVFLIPQRYVLGLMGFLAIMNAYQLRVCLNVAITEMVISKDENSTYFDPDACPDLDSGNDKGNSSSSIDVSFFILAWSKISYPKAACIA